MEKYLSLGLYQTISVLFVPLPSTDLPPYSQIDPSSFLFPSPLHFTYILLFPPKFSLPPPAIPLHFPCFRVLTPYWILISEDLEIGTAYEREKMQCLSFCYSFSAMYLFPSFACKFHDLTNHNIYTFKCIHTHFIYMEVQSIYMLSKRTLVQDLRNVFSMGCTGYYRL